MHGDSWGSLDDVSERWDQLHGYALVNLTPRFYELEGLNGNALHDAAQRPTEKHISLTSIWHGVLLLRMMRCQTAS